jgi:hypothetical protein
VDRRTVRSFRHTSPPQIDGKAVASSVIGQIKKNGGAPMTSTFASPPVLTVPNSTEILNAIFRF